MPTHDKLSSASSPPAPFLAGDDAAAARRDARGRGVAAATRGYGRGVSCRARVRAGGGGKGGGARARAGGDSGTSRCTRNGGSLASADSSAGRAAQWPTARRWIGLEGGDGIARCSYTRRARNRAAPLEAAAARFVSPSGGRGTNGPIATDGRATEAVGECGGRGQGAGSSAEEEAESDEGVGDGRRRGRDQLCAGRESASHTACAHVR